MTETHHSAAGANAHAGAGPAGQAGSPGQAPPSEAALPSNASSGQAPPSDEELRAAYEAELNRITSAEMVIQTVVSLLNIGGRRLGLAPGSEAERDLEQVRDAIDGVRALMPILERRMPAELRPLRDALAQLQMAYAREAAAPPPGQGFGPPAPGQGPGVPQPGQAGGPPPGGASQAPPDKPAEQGSAADAPKGPGPAESSGRLWVPGR